MSKTTIKDQIIAALTGNGWTKTTTASAKYEAFKHDNVTGRMIFVGKSGALRWGKTASDSFSLASGASAVTKAKALRFIHPTTF